MVRSVGDRTYVECKRHIRELHMKKCEVSGVDWDEMQGIYHKVHQIMEPSGKARSRSRIFWIGSEIRWLAFMPQPTRCGFGLTW